MSNELRKPFVSYDYGTIRVMPRVERGEFINVGVILYCRTQKFLDAKTHFDFDKLGMLDPNIDIDAVGRIAQRIALFSDICGGHGAIGAMEQAERFHWLVAYRSGMIQASSIHSGICSDPAVELALLFDQLV